VSDFSYLQVSIALVAMLILMSACSPIKTEIRTQIQVDAPSKVVWSVLTDFDAYKEWNPYHVLVLHSPEGPCAVKPECISLGDPLHVFIKKPDGARLDLEVSILALEAEQKLFWGGGITGIFKGEHRFILRSDGPDRTILHHDEDFSGLALPFVPLRPDLIEKGYQLMNKAVKERAEAIFNHAARAGGINRR